MTLSLGLALVVMLVGLIVLIVQKRINEIWGSMFLAGLIVVLLSFGGHFTASITGGH